MKIESHSIPCFDFNAQFCNSIILGNNKANYVFGIHDSSIKYNISNHSQRILATNIENILVSTFGTIYDWNQQIIVSTACKYWSIKFSPNGKILCRSGGNYVFNSVDDMLNSNNRIDLGSYFGILIWINDNQIVGYTHYQFVRFVIEDDIVKKSYVVPFNLGEWTPCAMRDGTIIGMNDKKIVKIDIINNIKIINNDIDIIMYNYEYDVFISDKMLLYKMIGDCFVKFMFEYDFWRDGDKPQHMQDIIDVFIELDLFPIEIYNVVYQQMMIIKS